MSQAIVVQFLDAFYQAMMKDRNQILSLYRDSSFLTYNGGSHVGVKDISEHIKGLGFKKIEYKFEDYDAQPVHGNGILIAVTGQLRMDDSDQFNFSQTFLLMPEGQSWFLQNDILKISV